MTLPKILALLGSWEPYRLCTANGEQLDSRQSIKAFPRIALELKVELEITNADIGRGQ